MPATAPSNTLTLGGKIFRFGSVWGDVVGSHKHSETDVWGGGGGAGNGAPTNVVIRSSVTVKQEFFLTSRDGKERPIQLSGVDIPIRDGQKITMVSASVDGDATFYWVRIVNHAAGRWWATRRTTDLMERWFVPPKWKRLLIGVGVAVATFVAAMAIGLVQMSVTKRVSGAWAFSTIAAVFVVPFIYDRWRHTRLRDDACRKFDEHCQLIVDWALREHAVAPSEGAALQSSG
jgi:hypothetical protein